MKKNWLLYLFMIVCMSSFFTSCDKDDDKPTTPEWKEALGDYKADGALKLIINTQAATAQSAAPQSATLAAGTGENAKITLKNILPEEAEVAIDNVVPTKSGGDYTFSGTATVGSTSVTLTGKLTGIKTDARTLDLTVTRKIASSLVGNWALNLDGTNPAKALYFNVKSSNPLGSSLGTVLPGVLGGMLIKSVSEVNIFLPETGLFNVNWKNQGDSEVTGMPDAIAQIVQIPWFESDGKLYIALSKDLLPLLAGIPGLPEGLDMNTLIALLVDKGGYYALPFNQVTSDGVTKFYFPKEILKNIVPILLPFLGSVEGIPASVLPLLGQLPEIVASAETFDVGLSFAKK
ncbi:hypothetical protein AGMMS49574_08480 [Bacteroidia bacterium]|nr:hypothetical protein AGMMS49574_08480 [Bacteroidia bacterium]